ncbi:aminopeptidase NAALADL1 isoform X3 [Homo sapiens]|uniref:aminopeptidase NAALADL1 isoform X3 n=1 Tax=Homo sapiens TaxID=9606 RepID=UPI0005D01BB8|nr:aminopeptidase NAALADL1 isoform X3 [Homo sapiens]XP_054223325.1 aminopeptidase NAALADL1 isoform X3 [Homo sapiens]|eukprot:XP_011543010.1 N-acetylated-alpha-linked acidic dipeptidase-like protein isoform X3 [Homo sapiens]
MQWTKVLGLGLGAAALLGLGIILGHFAIPKKANSLAPQDLDLEILETVMGQLDAHRIRENLRELSREPHLASSPRDEDLVQLLLQRWKDPESGLDSAEASTYEVLLSFPSQEQPNVVDIVGPTGGIIHSCHRTEENVTGEQGGPDVVQPYAAYAPSGTPQGLLVYANRGAEEDFKELQTQGIKLEGTIALTRYGGVGRGAKAVNAAKHGVAGVLVYTDPADINDGLSSPDETFPNSWYLPPSGVERGSYYEYFGDPLTPYLPAVPSSFRVDLANVSGFPPIPTQPIGFQDARDLLCNLNGTLAPATWQGALGCHYRLGPGFRPDGDFPADSQVNVSVYNRLELRNSSNVLGIIRGAVEPDRYVLYGNHRDSWVHGAVDPSSGTAVLLELSRVLGTLLKKGTWRPRRSIVFASWGAEEFGLIGSTEFTEEFFNKLQERTVAYINVDISVFDPLTRPWRPEHLRQLDPVLQPQQPGVRPGPQSKTSARIYPTYHTAFDTFDYVDKFLDPGFSSHQAVARTAGSVILRLSDSFFLPLKVSDYSETLRSFLQAAQQDLGALLEQHSISLGPLVTAVEKFEAEAAALGQRISTLQKGSPDPLQVRMLNDQLMLLERTFLNPRAFPEERYYSHVLWAPRTGSVVTFPGLSNACSRARDTASGSEAWAEVQRQLSIVVTALEGAAATLRPVADL